MSIERTLVLIKPDGVARNLTGAILGRIEAKGYTLAELKKVDASRELLLQCVGVGFGSSLRVSGYGFGAPAPGVGSGPAPAGMGRVPRSLFAIPFGRLPVDPDARPDPVPPGDGEEGAHKVHGRLPGCR